MSTTNNCKVTLPSELIHDLSKHYYNLRVLREGGTGVAIIEAEEKKSGKIRVIKLMNFANYNETKYKDEVQIMKKLNSFSRHRQNRSSDTKICRTIDISKRTYKTQQGEQCFGIYVMEHMDCDLLDFILEHELTCQDEIKYVFREICKAVKFLHSKQIAHLDLKPENILLKLRSHHHHHSLSSGDAQNDDDDEEEEEEEEEDESKHHRMISRFQRIKSIKLCDFGSAKIMKSIVPITTMTHKRKSSLNYFKRLLFSSNHSGFIDHDNEEDDSTNDDHSSSSSSSPSSSSLISSSSSQQRCMFGTTEYLPPECLEKFNINNELQYDKVDMYSLGVILHVLCTNTFPKLYADNNDDIVVSKADLTKLKIIISEECYDLVRSLMNDDPSLRPSISSVLSHPFFTI